MLGLPGPWKTANGSLQQIKASFTLWMEPLAASNQQAEDLIVAVEHSRKQALCAIQIEDLTHLVFLSEGSTISLSVSDCVCWDRRSFG
jgi:hypothetical protein